MKTIYVIDNSRERFQEGLSYEYCGYFTVGPVIIGSCSLFREEVVGGCELVVDLLWGSLDSHGCCCG
jgi:hypothetical protein